MTLFLSRQSIRQRSLRLGQQCPSIVAVLNLRQRGGKTANKDYNNKGDDEPGKKLHNCPDHRSAVLQFTCNYARMSLQMRPVGHERMLKGDARHRIRAVDAHVAAQFET